MDKQARINADIIPYTAEYARNVLSWIESEETLYAVCRSKNYPPADNLIDTWQRKDVTSFLMSSGGRVVAYGELWSRPLELAVEIAHLIVDPYKRGEGYGSMMLDLLYSRASARPNVAKVVIHLFNEDPEALGCFVKAGFEIQGTTTYTQGLKLVRLVEP
jgi:ribosomal protein S18 acetylase RimI-like enzyme